MDVQPGAIPNTPQDDPRSELYRQLYWRVRPGLPEGCEVVRVTDDRDGCNPGAAKLGLVVSLPDGRTWAGSVDVFLPVYREQALGVGKGTADRLLAKLRGELKAPIRPDPLRKAFAAALRDGIPPGAPVTEIRVGAEELRDTGHVRLIVNARIGQRAERWEAYRDVSMRELLGYASVQNGAELLAQGVARDVLAGLLLPALAETAEVQP